MATENNATCPICGKPFKICHTCEDNKINSWKTVTDTKNCFDIHIVLHRYYVSKKISKDEAKAMLKNCDLSKLNSFPEGIKKMINEIAVEPKVEKKPVVEDKSTQESTTVKKTVNTNRKIKSNK